MVTSDKIIIFDGLRGPPGPPGKDGKNGLIGDIAYARYPAVGSASSLELIDDENGPIQYFNTKSVDFDQPSSFKLAFYTILITNGPLDTYYKVVIKNADNSIYVDGTNYALTDSTGRATFQLTLNNNTIATIFTFGSDPFDYIMYVWYC